MLIYALTILVSAFLLFQVQPVIAKIILPWFGGSAAVWTVCLLFFQMVLLLGYLYAHALTRYLKPRVQMIVHMGMLALSAAVLPIYPAAKWKPSGTEDPTLGILGLLALTVGLPYFLLSTTGPLVQAWYARRFKGAVPYRLYALSNAGSMFALLSYPVLFEPVFGVHEQASIWSWAYAVFFVLCAATAWVSSQAPVIETLAEEGGAPKPGARQYALWMALPACASVLLLAITNHLSQNVAAIPFLWVLPLSIYLLTFILCFEGDGWYRRNPYLQLLAVALGSMAYAGGTDLTENVGIKLLVPLYSLGLFTCCMVCHGELVMLKPHPRYLTQFYLMISAGGALGGILVGLVAPRVLSGFYEMPLALVACAALIVVVLKQDPDVPWFRNWWQPAPAVAVVLTASLAVYIGLQMRHSMQDTRVLARNFYGGLKVRDSGPATRLDATRSLTHGTINHGEQFLNPARRDWPTTYYGPNTGVGIAIRDKQKTGAIRVGVIGLGTGTIASYGRLGDYYRYYEINPLVLKLATSEFTFLPDCKARHDVAMGDARLSLEREQPENLDVLAVDAFSSDAIPVHLLTKQAMELYFHHLRPNGILAVHISNRYLDLEPVVEEEAEATGHVARLVDTSDDDDTDVFGATWVLVTAPAPGFDEDITQSSTKIELTKRIRLWTDDYSNLFQILK
ncbi:MAG TPA: fused MFS/spermidine synthase [Bryobacteraceae bacterium]|nr:fused MFS/spermidine synthase [Bryobacteraceae bacterium]